MRTKRNRNPPSLRTHWSWFVPVLSWPAIEKRCWGIVVFPAHRQEKPCCRVEVDRDTSRQEKWWQGKKMFQDMLWMRPLSKQVGACLDIGSHRAKRQADSRTKHTQGKEHFHCRKVPAGLVRVHGKCPVSTGGGGTWRPQACRFLKLSHRIHSPYEKRLIERTMQGIKYRTEGFDGCFPCRKARLNLHHIKDRLNLFAIMHNKKAINA